MRLLISLILLFSFSPYVGALTSLDRAEFSFPNSLQDSNPGFESGTVKWSGSGGTFTINSTPADQFVAGSKQFAVWDSDGAAQERCSELKKVPESGNCAVSLTYKVPSGTATHKIVAKDGSKDLAVEDVFSSTAAWRHDVEFPCAAAASNQARVCLRSVASNEPAIQLDGGYAGEARNVGKEGALGPTTPYTPTLNSMTGVAELNATKQRVGDGYELVIGIRFNGAGAAGSFSATVPTECTVDRARLPDTANVSSILNQVGVWGWYDDAGGGATDNQMVYMVGTQTMGLMRNSNSVASNIFANADRVVLRVRVPCVGFLPSTIVTQNQQRTPKVTVYTSGSGTHSWSNGVTYAEIEMVGGGGGGSGSGTASSGAGGAGGNTTFAGLLTANGGAGGVVGTGLSSGGSVSVSSPAVQLMAIAGANGGGTQYDNLAAGNSGGAGASSCRGGAGGQASYSSPGFSAKANSGSGGGGAAANAAVGGSYSGQGGAAGGCIRAQIIAPSGTAAYAVGAAGSAGTAGTNGYAGGAGGSGEIIVTEHFGYTTAILANSVISNVTNGIRIEGASIDNTGTATITRQTGSWINSVSRTGTGVVEINYSSSLWSVAPICTLTVNAATLIARVESITTTKLTTRMITSAGTSTDNPFYVQCMGPR